MPSKYQRKSKTRDPFKKIIIATEGNKTECNYFIAVKKKYRASTLDIILLKRDELDTRSAPIYVFRQLDGYRKKNKIDEFDELWIVIDTDNWPNAQLSDVAQKCAQQSYFLGVSNPCFEIWLIFHYVDISLLPDAEKDSLCAVRNTKSKWTKIREVYHIGHESKIVENIRIAIENSRKMEIDPNSRWPNTLGTHIFRLADSILTNSIA
jgi:hypothetical protein